MTDSNTASADDARRATENPSRQVEAEALKLANDPGSVAADVVTGTPDGQAQPLGADADRAEAGFAAPHADELPEQPMPALATPDAAESLVAHEVEPEAVQAASGFAELGLSPELLQALVEKGYQSPTPIQSQAIPTILMGRDVLGCAQTGTGKTASFVLPMLDILSSGRARARMPRSLILEPTRELALQVAENFAQYGKHLKLSHALLIGGESLNEQKDVLMRGVDVLIATPGRLMDLFERGGLLLTDVKILVIDEADRMLDMGFIPDIEKIVGFLPPTRQTLFFSATMAPEIRRLADAFLSNAREITVSRPATIATTIVAGVTVIDNLDKREALRRLIRGQSVQNALIFCNRKRDVDILYKSLKRHDFSVGQLHGDMSQSERFATLARFKGGEIRLLVCSDVAARGIDIGGLSHVFNFDVPIHAEDYVHRIGRTGRAGLTGHAFTLATPDDRQFVEAIEKLVGAEIPRFTVDGMDLLVFSEDDGKRRRGRGRAKAVVKPVAREKPAAAAAEDRVRKPRRRNARKSDADQIPPESAPQPEISAEAALAPLPAEPRRPRDVEPRRARDDHRRGRDEPRRFRRDDDLGPAVLGFGDDVPAFMLLRTPVKSRELAETE